MIVVFGVFGGPFGLCVGVLLGVELSLSELETLAGLRGTVVFGGTGCGVGVAFAAAGCVLVQMP